jgi:NAD-dependent SIR2 family protein deacetylase
MELPNLDSLVDLVGDGDVLVLSGAGLSTESGIPDYRGPSGAARPATPMTFQAFTGSPAARRRYWARSHVGWRVIARAEPNAGHRSVARLQDAGLLTGVITQNVDGLHTAAGARDVVELHGNLDRVVCLSCGRLSPGRSSTAGCARSTGPGGEGAGRQPRRRRGPARGGPGRLPDRRLRRLRRVLKPDVVFFGETVPADRVARCFRWSRRAGAARARLLADRDVGYRFVLHAAKLGIPVAIVNLGATRGDDRASVRGDAPLGEVLSRLVEAGAGQRPQSRPQPAPRAG